MSTTTTAPKTKSPKKFYLGWRSNPQLHQGGYYKAFGQLSKTEVRKKENCVYGSLSLTSFDTEEEYQKKIQDCLDNGFRVN